MTNPEYTSAGSNDRLLNWLKDAYARDAIDLLDLEQGTAALVADEPLPAHLLDIYAEEGKERLRAATATVARFNNAPGQIYAYDPVLRRSVWTHVGGARHAPPPRRDRVGVFLFWAMIGVTLFSILLPFALWFGQHA